MKRAIIFNISIVCIMLGALLIGVAIGIIFKQVSVGLLTGLGVGCFLVALILLRTHKELLVYNKETI